MNKDFKQFYKEIHNKNKLNNIVKQISNYNGHTKNTRVPRKKTPKPNTMIKSYDYSAEKLYKELIEINNKLDNIISHIDK